jgi:hypothetical protein
MVQERALGNTNGIFGFWETTLPHFLDSRLTDGETLLSLLAGRPLPTGRFLVLISVKRLRRPQAHSADRRIRSIENNPVT